jgi:hypothetical protein
VCNRKNPPVSDWKKKEEARKMKLNDDDEHLIVEWDMCLEIESANQTIINCENLCVVFISQRTSSFSFEKTLTLVRV